MYKQKSENGDKTSVFLKQTMKKFSLFCLQLYPFMIYYL